MNLYRWVIMLVIGLLTAFVAVGIDISIEQLAGWKYKILKHRILFKHESTNQAMIKPYSRKLINN